MPECNTSRFRQQVFEYYFTISNLLFIIIYPLPNLPPRGKEWIYLSPLGENERGYKLNKYKTTLLPKL